MKLLWFTPKFLRFKALGQAGHKFIVAMNSAKRQRFAVTDKGGQVGILVLAAVFDKVARGMANTVALFG